METKWSISMVILLLNPKGPFSVHALDFSFLFIVENEVQKSPFFFTGMWWPKHQKLGLLKIKQFSISESSRYTSVLLKSFSKQSAGNLVVTVVIH